MTKKFFIVATVSLLLLTGCTAYQVSTQSLSDQLNGNTVDKSYFTATNSVKGNDLKTIKCTDNKGNIKEIAVTNRTGIKITKNDSTKTTFYANTLLIKDGAIYGSKTHFFNAQIKPINLIDIAKIEVMK